MKIVIYVVAGILAQIVFDRNSLFDVDEPSIKEWGNHVIYEHLTVKGKPEAFRDFLDFLWGIIRFVLWPLILISDLLLKLWYDRS